MTLDAAPGAPVELIEELRRAGITDVDASPRRRAEYATDASLYRVPPRAVAFPRSTDDVQAIVETCRRLAVPVTARGAGTSVAGNAVGPGLVVDFSRYLNRIVDIDPNGATALVQPGVVLDDLQRSAGVFGLRFGPDPSTHSRCTIGGMIGNNACGSRALGFGRTSDNTLRLALVTGTAERLDTASVRDVPSPVITALTRLVAARLAVIRTELGRFGRQVSGYALEHLLPERGFDLAKALVGSEGTLGVLEHATVRLVPIPRVSLLVVLGYPDMATAADAVPALLHSRPIAVEGIDGRMVDMVRRRTQVPPLPPGRGWLMVELAGDDQGELLARARTVCASAQAIDHAVVTDAAEQAALWRIREDGAGLAARLDAARPGQAGWEDAAVPPEHLGAYLRDFDTLLDEHDLTGVPYGHFGDGCVHVRINFPFRHTDGRAVFADFVRDAARLVVRYGGSLSGEHGDGRARSALLPEMYSPDAITLFGEVKSLFDPQDVLNPGVLTRPQPVDLDLRELGAQSITQRLGLLHLADGGDFGRAVHRCTGVGKCRTTTGGGVMCPSFRATRDEKDSTRARSRVLQELANGGLVSDWRSPAIAEALDLCLSCKACSTDCPTGVDMAKYKAEALYQRYRRRVRPATHYSLGWLPRWARLASRRPALANRALSGRLGAVGKRLAGVDPRRGIPTFAAQTFHRWFAGHPQAPGEPVLLWIDTFTNHFTPDVGRAAVEVLEAAGYSVRVAPPSACCGLTWISTGQLDAARRILGRTVEALAGSAGAGVPIVGLEPSCTAVLRSDAADLLGETPAVMSVRSATRTLAELLETTPGWQPPDLSATRAVVQPHCHHYAVMGFEQDRRLLVRAGASIDVVAGCCGLAGNFGAERGHYDVSVAVAQTSLLPAIADADAVHGDSAIVIADGFSCRTQVGDLLHRRPRHLAELLADAARDR